MNKTQNLTLLAARVLLALIFVAAGASKITDYAGTQAYMQSVGVPGVLLPLVIALELGGGLAVIFGLWTGPLSWLLAGFTLVAAALFHHNFSDPMQMILFMKNLAIAGGLMGLAAAGSGAYGLDARLGRSAR
jgi:putative oxidoreductase